MKQLLWISFFLPFYAIGQECKIITTKDPYTKETKISSGFFALQGATLTIEADSKEIDFFFIIEGKCFDDASTAFLFFEGARTRTTYRNGGSRNCDGYFHIKYKNSATPTTVLKKLASQNTAHFVFTGTDKKETTVSLLPEQQKMLMEITACMLEEAKKLIP